ncbi:probable oligoribonuclease isoform X2 [Orussus abietinus]|nr:probable oligoribonuclease isoform X2 [Orussus abietinus]XP_012276248.1 probable oligoribonuclease isoform X2 [Orussus abietinus]XP_012276250.1 probable oligoribonuclease isoform X2 [Orussus abietinus]
MSSQQDSHIVWIDTELTGLDLDASKILEVACLVTDSDLNVTSPEFEVIINQPDSVLNNMDEWCLTHHGQSGLIKKCQASTIMVTEAEQMLLEFLKKYVPKGKCPLAGNTVYMDRFFLSKHMPKVNEYLHYRIIDVSSIKEVARRWYKDTYSNAPKKHLNHRALADIKESLQEMIFYKQHIFK